MRIRQFGIHLLYAGLMALWVYLGYLASTYGPDAAFTFWITAIGGGVLTLIRWVGLVRGTAPVYHVSDQDHADTGVKQHRSVAVANGSTDEGEGATRATARERPESGAAPDRRTLALTDESWRILRVVGSLLLILVGMRLVGMHIVLPLFVAGYLYIWAEVRSVIALVSSALAIFLALVLVFDYLLLTPWPISGLESLLEQRWGRLFSGYLPW